MDKCCIEGCGPSSDKDVVYFDFPTSRLLRKRWLDAIGCDKRSGARLCSRHFAPHEYAHVRGRVRLKGKAMPTLCLAGGQTPNPLKDPLAAESNTEESQNSTESNNDNHNGNVNNDNVVHNDNDNINEKVPSDGEKHSPSRENGHNEKNNDNETNYDNEKNNDNETNNDNGENNTKKVSNKRRADKVVNKKVKKKWVPMRPKPANGHLSEDSNSDSVNSDLPPPPILEDLEEHLPNYQIANMKTERQVAAMTDTIEPIEDVIEPNDDVEELTVEPHIPVFIELSVGQDNADGPPEQQNDCLMVVESVQCDIDPTLMLQARAEDEACCEQIDLDDDDDDDDVVVGEVTIAKKPVKSAKPVDPISLLTSSDEDDVILQEPHIDTLSVSDETDEDDLPLQKLIKREKKAKKRKKKPENIKDILVGETDFYCTRCQHISPTDYAHKKHLRTHRTDEQNQSQPTKVFQICKECGFTTSSKSQLHRHQKKHLNDKRFKCPLCSYRSKYNMSLMYHLKTHDFDPNMYNCGACGLELDSKKALLEHQNMCSEMCEKFLCNVCGYISNSKRTLKIHRNTVHKHKG